jgi:hypothetical protein
MSGVFQNIDPPPPHRPASVYPLPAFGAGEDTLAGWRGGGGSIVRKTPDTALYSTYICKHFVIARNSHHMIENRGFVKNS